MLLMTLVVVHFQSNCLYTWLLDWLVRNYAGLTVYFFLTKQTQEDQ